MSKYNLACAAFEEVIKEKDCFTLKQLDINGHDLIKQELPTANKSEIFLINCSVW